MMRLVNYIMQVCLRCVFVTAMLSSVSYSAFNNLTITPRAMGMAEAFVCVKGTALNVYYNPSGLGGMSYLELITGYGKRYLGLVDKSDINNGFLSFAFPVTDVGTIGIGWYNLNLSGSYQEHVFIGSIGRDVSSNFNLGVSIKVYNQSFSSDAYTITDPLFIYNGYNKFGFGVDAGAIFHLINTPFSFGLVFSDFNEPNISLGGGIRIPWTLKAGINFLTDDWMAELDGMYRSNEISFHIGTETWLFNKLLALRGGLQVDLNGLRDGNFGFGIRIGSFEFNYGFKYPLTGILNTYGTHQTSLSFRFGDTPEKKEEKESNNLKKELELVKQQLEEVKAEKEKIKQESELNISDLKQKLTEKDGEIAKIEESKKELQKMLDSINKKTEEKEIKKEPKKETYVVKKGDNLKDLALKFYGDSKKWTVIYEANKEKISGGVLVPGTTLIIPR